METVEQLRQRIHALEEENRRLALAAAAPPPGGGATPPPLPETETRFFALFEAVPVGVMYATVDGKILAFNETVCRMARATREQVAAMDAGELYADQEERKRLKQRLAAERRLSAVPVRFRRRNGTTFSALATAALTTWNGAPAIMAVIEDVSERNAADEELQRYQLRLRSLATELSRTEERERRALAQRVHDSIGQSLYAIKTKVEYLGMSELPQRPPDIYYDVLGLINQAIQESRNLTLEVCPPALYEIGLTAALEWLAGRFEKRDGLAIRVLDDGQEKPMDDDTSGLAYQAVRELLNNVSKHARAKSVEIGVWREAETVRISVRDDGVGFDVAAAMRTSRSSRGFGLFSLRERITYVGGRWRLDSVPGAGSCATLVIPFHLAQPADELPTLALERDES